MIYRIIKNCFFAAVAAVVITACSDDLLGNNGDADKLDGMGFDINVIEQADIMYEYGQTRSGSDSLSDASQQAYEQKAYPLEGSGEDLYVHRMPLPFVGIHPHTVSSGNTEGTTRAPLSEIASNGISFHDSLTIWGFTSADGSATTKTLFNGTIVQKINGWRTACEWPYGESGTMKFYAVSPALESIEENITITNKASINYTTAPAFTYKVPDAPATQRDLVLGTSTAIDISTKSKTDDIGQDNKIVPMTFTHLLTAVRFAQGKMPTDLTIKRIKLNNIKNQGTYNGSWGSQSGSASYTIYPSFDVTEYNPTNIYIDGDSVLFLMPQTLGATASLEVVVRKDGEATDRTLTCAINGDVWNPGYTVTYKITIGEMVDDYYLLVGPSPGTTALQTNTHDAGSASNQTFTVHSYKRYLDYTSSSSGTNSDHAARWKVVKYSTDGTNYSTTSPTWLTVTGAGTYQTGGSNRTLTYSLTAQSPVYTLNHATVLGNNGIGGASNLDLSCYRPNGNGFDKLYPSAADNGSTKQPYQTANCYIVNAAGTYCFPVVYGNAYEGSTSAKTGSALNPGDIFKDHSNRAIEHGHIIDQVNYTASTDVEVSATDADKAQDGCSAATRTLVTTEYLYNKETTDYQAALIWQDVNGQFTGTGIISSPIKGGSAGYIGFTVGPNPQPGNCVIAFQGKKTTHETRKIYNGSTHLKTVETYSTAAEFETLWTWHIWCTDEVLPNNNTTTVTELSGKQIDLVYPRYDKVNSSKIPRIQKFDDESWKSIMPVNLGWVPQSNEEHIYQDRDVWLEIEQETSGKTAHVKIHQDWVPEIISGTSTIYQWGRPTALPMLRQYDGTTNGTTRDVYGTTSTPITSDFTIKYATLVGENALYPKNMLRYSGKKRWWAAETNYAFWSSTKTIYDPCPAGYQLPAGGIFTGLSLTGVSSVGSSSAERAVNLNMWTGTGSGIRFYEPKKGGYMYAAKHTSISYADRDGTIVFFPAQGLWSGDNDEGRPMSAAYDDNGSEKYLFKDASQGYYWTYDIVSDQDGIILSVEPDRSSGEIYFGTAKDVVDAVPIRPMAQ